MTQTPPESAVILFDGTDLSNWTSLDGSEPSWQVEGDAMLVVPRSGDVISKETFTDHFVHVEFRCPDMPEATGQAKGNSGVFLQGRYEVQVLDSYGIEVPGMGDCGAIYNQFAPLVNACKPPLEWQTYDVIFRAPRFNDAGENVEGPRITVIQNGLVIINNAQMAAQQVEAPIQKPLHRGHSVCRITAMTLGTGTSGQCHSHLKVQTSTKSHFDRNFRFPVVSVLIINHQRSVMR